jgi:hypothetical protein
MVLKYCDLFDDICGAPLRTLLKLEKMEQSYWVSAVKCGRAQDKVFLPLLLLHSGAADQKPELRGNIEQ